MAKKISQLTSNSNPNPDSEVVTEYNGTNNRVKIKDLLYSDLIQNSDGNMQFTRNQLIWSEVGDPFSSGPGFRFRNDVDSNTRFESDLYLDDNGDFRFAGIDYRTYDAGAVRDTFAKIAPGRAEFWAYDSPGANMDLYITSEQGDCAMFIRGYKALAGIELEGAVNIVSLRDTDSHAVALYPAQQLQDDWGLRFTEQEFRKFNIVNSNGKFGVDSISWNLANYASLFDIYPHKVIDGNDGNGAAYGWGGGNHPVWAQFNFAGAFVMGPLDTSDTTNMLIRENGNGCFYLDKGTSWNFRMREDANYHRMYLINEGSGGTIGVDGAGGTVYHVVQRLDGVNNHAAGVRNVGSPTIPGSFSGNTHTEFPGAAVNEHQAAMQIQAGLGRISLAYTYILEDGNVFHTDPNQTTKLPSTGGSPTGFFGGLHIYGQGLGSSTRKRSITSALMDTDLGSTDVPFRDLYLDNPVTVASDEKIKQDIAPIDETEKKVAFKLKDLVKKYRLKSSVEKKGEEARIHIGWIAQEVEKAFSEEGLDATRYALFCRDTHYKVFVNGEDTGKVQRTSGQVQDEMLYESLEKIYEETGGEEVAAETKDSEIGVISTGKNQTPAPKKRKIIGIADEVTFEPFDAYSLRYEELISFIISAL